MAGNTLRWVVYEPILEGYLLHAAEPARRRSTRARHAATLARLRRLRLLAACAVFAASGAMHELQFFYLTGHTTYGLMMAFFLGQIPLMLLEQALGAVLRCVW